jgi:hypothetical protein
MVSRNDADDMIPVPVSDANLRACLNPMRDHSTDRPSTLTLSSIEVDLGPNRIQAMHFLENALTEVFPLLDQ